MSARCLGAAVVLWVSVTTTSAWAGAPVPEHRTIFGATGEVAFRIWRSFLTRGDGPRCQLEPSCSRFGAQALARDGVPGALLVVDRFVREPNGFTYPRGERRGSFRDPLSDHPPPLALLSGTWCRSQRRRGAATCL